MLEGPGASCHLARGSYSIDTSMGHLARGSYSIDTSMGVSVSMLF
jgi:hypothetical protein